MKASVIKALEDHKLERVVLSVPVKQGHEDIGIHSGTQIITINSQMSLLQFIEEIMSINIKGE